jgi:hypothetical protein
MCGMEEVADLTIEAEAKQPRIQLPLAQPDFSLTQGSWGKRLLSAGAIAWAILCLSIPLLFLGGSPGRLFHWPSDYLILAIWIFCLFGLAAFTTMGWFMAGAILLGFFPTQIEIEVQHEGLVVRRQQGPWSWTRRIESVKTLRVLPPATISSRWLNRPLEEKTTRLSAETKNGRHVRIVTERPYAILKEVAAALADLIAQRSDEDAPAVIDHVDPAARQADVETPPPGAAYCVRRTGDNMLIMPVERMGILRALPRNPIFRAGIWTAVLPYLLLCGAMKVRPDLADVLRPVSSKIVLVQSMLGFVFIVGAWYSLVFRRMYLITAEELIQVNDLRVWKFSRRWKRREIAAVRLGQRIGDKGRYFDVLELVLNTGRTIQLQSGFFGWLQYLGTVLRRELGVPAELPASRP